MKRNFCHENHEMMKRGWFHSPINDSPSPKPPLISTPHSSKTFLRWRIAWRVRAGALPIPRFLSRPRISENNNDNGDYRTSSLVFVSFHQIDLTAEDDTHSHWLHPYNSSPPLHLFITPIHPMALEICFWWPREPDYVSTLFYWEAVKNGYFMVRLTIRVDHPPLWSFFLGCFNGLVFRLFMV